MALGSAEPLPPLTSYLPHQTLISGLQQHFLLFSQRLHAAEVERRSLRLEVSNLKKGLQQERAELVLMVSLEEDWVLFRQPLCV